MPIVVFKSYNHFLRLLAFGGSRPFLSGNVPNEENTFVSTKRLIINFNFIYTGYFCPRVRCIRQLELVKVGLIVLQKSAISSSPKVEIKKKHVK
jgi:hypothetical protein